MHVNVFDTKTDEELILLYNQFLEAEKNGAFPDNTELAKIKREYEKDFGAKTTLMLQIELTHVIADRWFKEHNKREMKELYIVEDVPKYLEDNSSYKYVVKANNYDEAIEMVKNKTGHNIEWDASLADNDEIWQ